MKTLPLKSIPFSTTEMPSYVNMKRPDGRFLDKIGVLG